MEYKVYRKECHFNFGKHKGETLTTVANEEPTYIWWCIENVDWFVISEDYYLDLMITFSLDKNIQRRINKTGDELLEHLIKISLDIFQEKYDNVTSNIENHVSLRNEPIYNEPYDYSESDLYTGDRSNPWVDVFGPGEEAHAAYWNTH